MSTDPGSPGFTPAAFKTLGVLVEEGFATSAFCIELGEAARASTRAEAAGLYNEARGSHVDEDYRRTRELSPGKDLLRRLESLFESARPRVAQHFGLRLDRTETPLLLRYRAGDFFKPHVDDGGKVDDRRVSVVLFVNAGPGTPAPEYTGGALRIFGLLKGGRWDGVGMPITPAPGTLVAFPAGLMHEVLPVADGERLTVVTWYHGPKP